MTDKLSARAYRNAVRMWESDRRMVKPKPEDFDHLDVMPSRPPAEPKPPALTVVHGGNDEAVRAALTRMQEATRVSFLPPDDAA